MPVPLVPRGYDVVRILMALVLLTAAFLKAYQLSSEPVIGHSILDNRWLLMGVVEFELLFGLWLLANILPKVRWVMALGCFAAFTCVSLYKALAGYATCGCFGAARVNPWLTSTGDCAFVLSLLIWRPRGRRGLFHSHVFTFARCTAVLAPWLLVGLPAAYAMASYHDTTFSDAGTIVGDGKIVLLEPEKWIGKRFPLLPFIEDVSDQSQPSVEPLRDRLAEGDWLVVLYHHECTNCQKAMPKFEEFAHQSAANPKIPRLAMIELPPYSDSLPLSCSFAHCTVGRLSGEKEWFVETPVAVSMRLGAVGGVMNDQEIGARFAPTLVASQ